MVRGARPALPIRTCVGCRKRAPTSELLRVVAVAVGPDQVRVEPDPGRVRPGRGASVHPDPACLTLATRRHAFGRALRVTGAVDVGPLRGQLGIPGGGTPVPPGQAR